MISEKEVLELFEKKPELGLKILHKYYADLCFSVSMRYLNNKEEAEEMVMNTYLKAYSQLNRFEWTFEGCLKAWLKKITVNECLMLLRKQKLRFEFVSEDNNYSNIQLPIDKFVYQDIIKALNTLPLSQRTVFQLYELDGFTHKEIAEKLQISMSTSKSNLNRAKSKLKERLTALGYNN